MELPLAPPSIANWSLQHRSSGRRFPSKDLIEVIHNRCLDIQENIASDALLATFCSVEAATVNLTLEYIRSIMALSTEMATLLDDDSTVVSELWGQVNALLSDADKLQKHGERLPEMWGARQSRSLSGIQDELRDFLRGYRSTLAELTDRRDDILVKYRVATGFAVEAAGVSAPTVSSTVVSIAAATEPSLPVPMSPAPLSGTTAATFGGNLPTTGQSAVPPAVVSRKETAKRRDAQETPKPDAPAPAKPPRKLAGGVSSKRAPKPAPPRMPPPKPTPP